MIFKKLSLAVLLLGSFQLSAMKAEIEKVYVNIELGTMPDAAHRSAGIRADSELFNKLTEVKSAILKEFPQAKPPHNDWLHAELSSTNDPAEKKKNYNALQKSVNLTNLNNWECVGGAFALLLRAKHHGLTKDLHITIAFFPKGCTKHLERLKEIVAQTLGK